MPPGAITIPDILRVLGRRKFVLFLSGLATGAVALLAVLLLPPRFVTTGSLLVQTESSQIPQLILLNAPAQAPASRNQTESDMLRSRALIAAVVRKLDLQDNPHFIVGAAPSHFRQEVSSLIRRAAVAIGGERGARLALAFPPTGAPDAEARIEAGVRTIQRDLQITDHENSHVLIVSFAAHSPVVAAAVINTLFSQYIDNEIKARRAVMMQTNQWLSDRAAAFQLEVEAADRAVEQFRNSHPTFEVAQGSLASLQLSSEESELSVARQTLARLQTELANARRTGFRDALASPTIQPLRDREADAMERVAVIGRRLGVRHPEYIAALNSLQVVRQEIEHATDNALTSMERGVADAASRVTDLEARVTTSQVAAERSVATTGDLEQLTREADAKRRLYEAFMTRAAETQPSSAEFSSARVISSAVVPARPDMLPLPVVAIFGMLAGAFAAAAICILRYVERGGIGSVRELVALTDLPCLGALPVLPRRRRRKLPLLLDDSRDGAVETLRAMHFDIRMRVSGREQDQDGGGVVVLVTSSEIGDGKTTLAASFARLCAADGQRVLLIETDLRRPRLARTLGLRQAPDLEAVVAGKALLADAVQVERYSGLHCLMAKGGGRSPQTLLRSTDFATLLQRARGAYEFVVLDSPPVLHVADSLLIAGLSDTILFAARWERTPRALVVEALRRIPEDIRRRVATVLTQVPANRLSRGDHYAGYHMPILLGPKAVPLIAPLR